MTSLIDVKEILAKITQGWELDHWFFERITHFL